jgi:hypothetical protein
VPGNGRGRAPRSRRPGPDQQYTATNGTATKGGAVIVPDAGDPRRVGELVAEWVGAKLAEVDDLVAEGRSKVEAIPDQRAVWLLVGELVMRLHVVEQEVAKLRKAAGR